MKKIFSIVLTMCLLMSILSTFSIMVYATGNGVCGENLRWSLNDGVLLIEGTGDMYDYKDVISSPWYNNRNDIIKIVVAEGVTAIGNNAFFDCSNLTDISIPNSVLSIGESGIRNCNNLKALIIPEGVEHIGLSAFWGTSLESITIPNSVRNMGNQTFAFCDFLENVTIGDGAKTIPAWMFYGCDMLKNVIIGKEVSTIGKQAFYSCVSLKAIHIPINIEVIEEGAFNQCANLSDVYYEGTESDWNSIKIGKYNNTLINANVHYNNAEKINDKKTITVILNGEKLEFDQPPINTPEGRLLVPIRKIAESMNKTVLYSGETKTAFIDNTDSALIIPLYEQTMYIADENGFNLWEKVQIDVPAMELNGRTLVPIRAFCESLGATVVWNDEIKTAFITYAEDESGERMNDMLFDSINLVWYIERLDALWHTEQFPFEEHSVVIDDFYVNRPYWADAVTMGLSDPFAGIQDLISMTNGSDNATNIILQSLQEILSEVPSGTELNYDAEIVKILKDMVASGVEIYSDVGGLGYKIKSYNDAFVFLDDALLDYSKNYHSTVSGLFDLSVFTLEELAYLLTEYQTNIEYLDIFESKLREAGYSDETIEKSVSLLRTQYTDKFIGVMMDLRSACVQSSVSAVLTAGLTIAGQKTSGVGVGMLGWKVVFGVFGVNKKGESLKIFYGLYCIDNKLNSTFNNIITNDRPTISLEILELRRLIELLKAEKITAYKAMKNITNWYNEDSKIYADEQIEEIQKFSYRIFK